MSDKSLRERVQTLETLETLETENAELLRTQLIQAAKTVKERDRLRSRCTELEHVIAELRLEPEEPTQTRTSRLGTALFVSSMPLALAQQWWWFAAVALVGAVLMCWHSPRTPDVDVDEDGCKVDQLKNFDASARRAVVVGQQLTRRLGHDMFTPAHLLLALTRDREPHVIQDARELVLDLPTGAFVGFSGGLSVHFAKAELAARAENRDVRIIDLWHTLATDSSSNVARVAATHAPS